MSLKTDPARQELPETGILVRAQKEGAWENVDISELDKDSLRVWLRSRGGDNPFAENVVALLLGHSN